MSTRLMAESYRSRVSNRSAHGPQSGLKHLRVGAVPVDALEPHPVSSNDFARRGGSTVSIDAHGAEDRYRFEPADTLTPDRLFDRAWALTLLEKVLDLLAREYAAKGLSELFDQLKIVLTQGKGAVTAATLAAQLGKTAEAVYMAAHRLRKRYREILEEQIAATLDDPSEMEDEIRSLFEAITT